ncbi:isopentenyl-diphosphate Delta-isomerase [Cutibacterium avidum]|uniref:isopentenyl-diphosphate Delta-isomerase n=1 Tax=Cutibacterium avidum TaxID=33010 RepID=UPI00192BC3DA|nr:isopentenyl-diphosphate Delta-isomerase [Cutibacterium avidum]QQY15471.1 isopentenyl-diphosphate Delta-isomerase [Cutibacterium avidum]
MTTNLVRLVTETGQDAELIPVARAHTHGGLKHRAFSVLLFNSAGDVLLQRRSQHKERWPGFYANSCCGHPLALNSLLEDATQRVYEELGITVHSLEEAGTFSYQAHYPGTQWSENELDHVLVGSWDDLLKPDATEVGEAVWVPPATVQQLTPRAPWLDDVLRLGLAARSHHAN